MNNPGAVKGLSSLYNSGDLTSSLAVAGTWYTLTGTMVATVNIGFTLVAGVWTCQKPGWYVFTGDASLAVSGACRVSFGFFLNASATPVLGLETPMDVVSTSKLAHFGANQAVYLNYGDTITVKAKSDGTSISLTISSLNVTLREA